jgi:multiple sugar transport system ATP-binding protein
MGSPSMNIVKGSVERKGGLGVTVNDDEGSVFFPLPAQFASKVEGAEGRDIYLGMRPETITHEGAHAAGTTVSAFERRVDVIEPTGPDTMLVFTLGGIEAIARVRPEEIVPEGAPFRFEVNMDKVKLFDFETGMRL